MSLYLLNGTATSAVVRLSLHDGPPTWAAVWHYMLHRTPPWAAVWPRLTSDLATALSNLAMCHGPAAAAMLASNGTMSPRTGPAGRPQAAGAAYLSRLLKEERVAIAYFGEGTSSEGELVRKLDEKWRQLTGVKPAGSGGSSSSGARWARSAPHAP